MPLLEYLMVYTQSGLPIYSKCYGTFCKTAFKNPELLTGFLSAIETIPPTLSDGLTLDSIKMGQTQMRFSKTLPNGHSVVVGLSEDNEVAANRIFSAVSEILSKPQFVSLDWTHITSTLMQEFEDILLKTSLVDALHEYGGFADECPLGDRCPIHTNALTSRRMLVWNAVKDKYAALRAKMAGN
jgi:hypothetical protein